ncbi:extensin-1-like [Humulus lupulus]|uniref:extensin-1-like n=1 Tax=Humulus lupulus TaxID=3486 RepID=UPI002B405778|nr:extensin-1-like [Humulus lupulus]
MSSSQLFLVFLLGVALFATQSTLADYSKPPVYPPKTPIYKPHPPPVEKPTKPPPTPVYVKPKPPPTPVYVKPKPPPTPVYVKPKPPPTPVYVKPKPPPTPVYVKPKPPPTPVYVKPKPPPTPVYVKPPPMEKPKPPPSYGRNPGHPPHNKEEGKVLCGWVPHLTSGAVVLGGYGARQQLCCRSATVFNAWTISAKVLGGTTGGSRSCKRSRRCRYFRPRRQWQQRSQWNLRTHQNPEYSFLFAKDLKWGHYIWSTKV